MKAIITKKYGGVEVLEGVYPFNQIQQAHIKSETGRVVGKIVVKVI